MFFEIFEDLRFLKIFDPQIQIFKNIAGGPEISADLKNMKKWKIGHTRMF